MKLKLKTANSEIKGGKINEGGINKPINEA